MGNPLLDLLLAEGVSPDDIIIGHCDTVLVDDYCLDMAKTGAFVQLDTFFECMKAGKLVEEQLDRRINLIVALMRAGHHDKILLAHDAALRENMSCNGGTGVAFLPRIVFERLNQAGINDEEIRHMVVTNPANALT